MVNVAALYLLKRSGVFKGGSLLPSGRDEECLLDRYRGAKINDQFLRNERIFETYLDEGCRLKLSGKSSIKDMFGGGIYAETSQMSDYKQYAQKQLEMIEPPSFLEKIMVINKSVAHTKLGKIAGKATLGTLPIAMTMVALSARAYGATRHFVMDKLNLHETKNEKSFLERLSEIKNRVGYKSDLKKIQKLEKLRETYSLSSGTYWHPDVPRQFDELQEISSSNLLLRNYMDGFALIDDNGNGEFLGKGGICTTKDEGILWRFEDYQTHIAMKRFTPLQSKDLSNDIVRHMKAVEMIEPPTKTELKLMKKLNRYEKIAPRLYEDSPILAILDKSVNRLVKSYIAEKEKNDSSFQGEKSLMSRLRNIEKRNEAQERLNKLRALERRLKNNGR